MSIYLKELRENKLQATKEPKNTMGDVASVPGMQAKEQGWEMQGEICQKSFSSAALVGFSVLPFICPSSPLAIRSRGPTWQRQKRLCGAWTSTPSLGPGPRVILSQHQSLPGFWILPTALKSAQIALQINRPAKPGNLSCGSTHLLVSHLFRPPFTTRLLHLPSVYFLHFYGAFNSSNLVSLLIWSYYGPGQQ